MKQLTAPAYRRARDFMRTQARPLERAQFEHEFEGGSREAVLDALAAFQNPDGGYGNAIEPDLRLPASSAIATLTGLDVLRDLGAGDAQPELRRALAWVVAQYDPALPGWRCVPPAVDDFPHAGHWSWALHGPGGSWPYLRVPGARLLSHLQHWRALAPPALLAGYTEAFRANIAALDGALGCHELLDASTVELPELRERLCSLAVANVSRDPAKWTEYVNKPLRLAPLPGSLFAGVLAHEVSMNLDFEIDQQASDGGWQPNWSWQGAYPDVWEIARREWRGDLTLRALRSLRAYGRIEGL